MHFMRFTLCLLHSSTQRKHFSRWLRSLRKDYLLKLKQPWLVFDAIDYLSSLPLKGKRVFEYGSGGSTLFWLSNGAKCVSIEHNQKWYELMHPHFEGIDRIDYRLVLPEPSENKETLDIADPYMYFSDDVMFSECNFRKYVCQIDPFPDNIFDIVLVDGRARPSCIKHASKKVRIGGLIILDNSDREYYLRMTANLLQDFDRRIFQGVTPGVTWFTETSIFTRRV